MNEFIWYVISQIGLVVLVFIVIISSLKRKKLLIHYFFAIFLAYIIKKIIALFVYTPRPFVVLGIKTYKAFTSTSFYSMHTFIAFLSAFYLMLNTKKKYILAPTFILAGLVAYSRYALYLHWPKDIFFSIFLAFLFYLIVKKIEFGEKQ